MTLAADEQTANCRSFDVASVGLRAPVSPNGLNALQTLLQRSIATVVDDESELLNRVLVDAVEAFVAFDGAFAPAAWQLAPLLHEVGEQYAHRGLTADDLIETFRCAQIAAQRGLQFAIPRTSNRPTLGHVRANITAFVQQLQGQALIGWKQTRSNLSMSSHERRAGLGKALLRGPVDSYSVRSLAELTQTDLMSDYVVLVSTAGTLPPIVLNHEQSLAGADSHEVMIPAARNCSEFIDSLTEQVVIGPRVPLHQIADSAGPTRRIAELLHEGAAVDSRKIVPCTDLLASLVVDRQAMLTELIVAKHLTKMESMTPHRRHTTGELLLQWLERGLPIRQLARELGIPAQTAYSRMKSIRALFGSAIESPAQRLELIIALQATLPRWRAEASGAVDS